MVKDCPCCKPPLVEVKVVLAPKACCDNSDPVTRQDMEPLPLCVDGRTPAHLRDPPSGNPGKLSVFQASWPVFARKPTSRNEDECSSMELHSIDQICVPLACPLNGDSVWVAPQLYSRSIQGSPWAVGPGCSGVLAIPPLSLGCVSQCGIPNSQQFGGNTILPVLVPIRRMWGCAQPARGCFCCRLVVEALSLQSVFKHSP